MTVILLILLAVIVAMVFVEQSQRRIPVQYAKRMVGRKLLGGTSTYIPLKINMAGVIPVIFASSLLTLPQLVTQFRTATPRVGHLDAEERLPTSAPLQHRSVLAAHRVLRVLLHRDHVQPDEVADNMKKYGGFIPGIRPGKPTADYLDYVLSRITAAGSLYLAIVALIPTLAVRRLGPQPAPPFGGYVNPHPRRRRSRHRQAHPGSTGAAPLRRVP